jgi:hypothetical protein
MTTTTQTLVDRCQRALELIRAAEQDTLIPGLVFAEAALQTTADADCSEIRLAARHADRCLRAVRNCDDADQHELRDAHQLVVGVGYAGGDC